MAPPQMDFRSTRHDPRGRQDHPRAAIVRDLVQHELLPRIARQQAAPIARSLRPAPPSFRGREIVRFADLSIDSDIKSLLAMISKARNRGLSLEKIYLGLIQPAARQLNDRWAADTCDFATITLGMCQMHQVLRLLSSDFRSERSGTARAHEVLLVPASHEQHTFGLTMLAEFFRRDGWAVSSGPFATLRELGSTVHAQSFTIVGFSLSCDAGLTDLSTQITCVRERSCNRAVTILVGGRVFNEQPDLVKRIGADGTASDAKQAVSISRAAAEEFEACRN